MKPFYYIACLFLTCMVVQNSIAQNNPTQNRPQRRTPQQQRASAAQDSLPSITVRAAMKNQEQSKNVENMVWFREIYRNVDLNKENNSALYFPAQPIGDRMNLFTLVFKLMSQGKIHGYKYLDGREVFTEEYKLNFEDILKTYQVLYTTQGMGANVQYIINDVDIPGNEVTMYMLKEVSFFDQATGMYNSKVLAICPMLVRQEDEFGEPTRTPMFWLKYEDIRPYISRSYIMTSNLNNALTYTIDDFFNKRMYDGDIIKTTNMMNQSLAQQIKSNDPAILKHAQDSIENQLKLFEEKLWVPKDTTIVTDKKKSKDEKKSGKEETKTEKPKESKPDKSSTAPTKSVRRTR